MPPDACKTIDPRVRRTRHLLHEALERLLLRRDFEAISIQDITEAATLNRATFYDHYPDKASLLRCVVALRFQALLDARGVCFDGTCDSALKAIALGVCDYLAGVTKSECGRLRPLDPHLESAIVTVVKTLILNGLKARDAASPEALGIMAATVSSAIYGGAREWSESSRPTPSEDAAATIAALVNPILAAPVLGRLHEPISA